MRPCISTTGSPSHSGRDVKKRSAQAADGERSIISGAIMRMAPKQKENKNNSKKLHTARIREIGAAGIVDQAGIESGRIPAKQAAADLSSAGVTDEERHHLISEAAYYKAEQRSFAPGYELEDWLKAEREIAQRLSGLVAGDLLKNS